MNFTSNVYPHELTILITVEMCVCHIILEKTGASFTVALYLECGGTEFLHTRNFII